MQKDFSQQSRGEKVMCMREVDFISWMEQKKQNRLTKGELKKLAREERRRALPDLVIVDGLAEHRPNHYPDFNGDTRMFSPLFDEKALICIFERMAGLAKETGECLTLGVGSVGTYFELRIYPGEDAKVLMSAYKKEMVRYDERAKKEHEWELARYG